ncbi:MAG: S-layer homology domain-containing protein [Oscillospiraceae bacterium]|jgi:hypothetical protein|nr:S-layer homology domain-containing protein [Oscillospiraceae bacterium]
MRTKITAIVLAIALIFALTVPASAATFSDIVGHWSQKDMEEAVDRGLFSGYPDNTLKPSKSISVAETIQILSRLYSLSDESARLIERQYGPAAAEIIPSTGAVWAREALAICLASGSVLDSEVRGGGERFNNAIKKEVLAMWLVRTLLPEETLTGTETHFADSEKISERFLPYVAILEEIGVLQGDDANRFNPGSDVSRAVAATMINKTIVWRINRYGYMPIIEKFSDSANAVSGVILDYSFNVLRLRGTDAIVKEYAIPSTLTTTLTNAGDTAADLKSAFATIYLDDLGNPVKLAIDNSARWAQGVLTEFGYNISTPYVTLLDPLTNIPLTYSIEKDSNVTRNGINIAFSSLVSSNGFFTTMRLNSKKFGDDFTLDYSDQTLSGTVDTVKYDTISMITLMDGNVKYILPFNITDPPLVTRGNSDIRIDRIFEGESATVKVSGGILATVRLSVSEDNVKGIITSIIRSVDGDTLVINTENGSRTAKIDKGTVILSDSRVITLTDLSVGDTISLTYTGLVVTEAVLTKKASASGKLIGTVMLLNSREYEIVIQSDGELYYIELAYNTIILDGPRGITLRYADIPQGTEIIVFGEFIDSTSLSASSIIVG